MTAQAQQNPVKIQGFDALYGLEVDHVDSEGVRAHVEVREDLFQPFGLVHGGVYATIAESVASIGTWYAVEKEGLLPHGMSNDTSFLRSIASGKIHVTARPIHRGRTTWVWEVEMRDDEDLLCAVTRLTIAVHPAHK